MSDTEAQPDPTGDEATEDEATEGQETQDASEDDTDLPVESETVVATGIDPDKIESAMTPDDPANAETAQAEPEPEPASDPATHAYVAPDAEERVETGYTP